jgi:Tol biopolymer transport system component
MKLPIVPFIVAVTLLTVVVYLFNSTSSGRRTLEVPKLTRLADLDGIETEVAIAPDGNRYGVISSGELWLLNTSTTARRQLTDTDEGERFPDWSPDGNQITFSRGADTYVYNLTTNAEQLFRMNATSLSWSSTGRMAFIRDRALWMTDAGGRNEKMIVEADPNMDVSLRTPRFSPNALEIAFIKAQLNLRGEVWVEDVQTGMSRPVVSDRAAENPLDVGWINEGHDLVYLTNRAGAYSLWRIDFAESTINPLTQPLVSIPLERIGIAVWKDRIVVPRHFADSNLVRSDGTTLAGTERMEFDPAVSRDGKLIAYTVADDNRFEIWTAGANGENPTFRTLGREPRFAADGHHLIYTHADLTGNEDIWTIDIRNASAERVTDADEIDVAADSSPDGRSIAFSSARGGPISIWTIPFSGGKRLRINDAGFAPRFSPDGESILFWNRNGFWMMKADGTNPRPILEGVSEPGAGVWSPKGPAFFVKGEIRTADQTLVPKMDRPIWPNFDVLADGRVIFSPIDIRETGLWAIDLSYKER